MVAPRSFILTFEDGRIRAIREPRKYCIRSNQPQFFRKNPPLTPHPPLYPNRARVRAQGLPARGRRGRAAAGQPLGPMGPDPGPIGV